MKIKAKSKRNSIDNYSKTVKGWWSNGAKRHYMRSSWEFNYAYHLDYLLSIGEIVNWDYEADTYYFEKIKRGTRSYTPDFKVTLSDGKIEQHEVKGWMDAKSKTKLKRMKIYYPDVCIKVIDKIAYKAIIRSGNLLIKDK